MTLRVHEEKMVRLYLLDPGNDKSGRGEAWKMFREGNASWRGFEKKCL